ncbi:uncharacterized protein LOC119401603 [Rhipicephalus sanguineus]|nr:uncharacterized protein LOC119401603 [Rhipicephalus sanguineus]
MAIVCPLLAVCGIVCSVAAAAKMDFKTLYMSDTCRTNGHQPLRFKLSNTGSLSMLTVRSQRDDSAPWWDISGSCTSTLIVTSPRRSRITMTIEELDMYAEPKENYCIDFLDVRPLDSLVSRFCGSLEDTYPKTFASVGNKLHFKWNFYTGAANTRGFTILLTAFTEPVRGKNCTAAHSARDAQFLCANGRCIDARWRCDKRDNCGDASDEKGCRDEGSFLVILSICACIVVVVVSGIMVTVVWMRFRKPPSQGATVTGMQTAYSIPVNSESSNTLPPYSQPSNTGTTVLRSGNRY